MNNQKLNVFGVDVNSLLPILPKSPLGLVIAISIGLGIGLGISFRHYKATNSPPSIIVQANNLTRAEYERLQIGMQLVEVEAILGRGTEVKHSAESRVFLWKTPDGYKITASFTNGRLADKEQTGL